MATKPKKQINFFIPKDLWLEFSKKCLEKDISKTEALISLVKEFIKKK